ncbi:MAG TPA: MASE1 domain-containing protein [Nitrospiraceae bacterium]|nr:MASE1 domain-containing protein [Nitrospiraceae bacterium]
MEQDKHPFEFGISRMAPGRHDELARSLDSMEQDKQSPVEKSLDHEPDREGTVRSGPVFWLAVASVACAYVIAGKLGLLLAFVHASATAVWLPTGIALAAFLILGYRAWPGIFLGAFVVNILTEGSVATSIGIAAGNTLEGVAGAYVVNRFACGRRAFDRAQNVLAFAVLAGLVSTMISATCGVTSLMLGGFAERANYGSIWLTWWLGDMAGDLIVAPFLVLWIKNRHLQWSRTQLAEAALLCAGLVLVTMAVFGRLTPSHINKYPLEYLCLPCLVWAAYRFGPRETATANVILAGLAIWGTLRGFGPFAGSSPNESLLLLQAFMGVTSVLALTFAAVVSKKRRIEQSRERLLGELQDALAHIKTLRGLIPICATCKKVRNDREHWEHVESYIQDHSLAQFTHGLCPDCVARLYAGYQSAK